MKMDSLKIFEKYAATTNALQPTSTALIGIILFCDKLGFFHMKTDIVRAQYITDNYEL